MPPVICSWRALALLCTATGTGSLAASGREDLNLRDGLLGLSMIQPAARTTVANSLWALDAFPGAPELLPNSSITIAEFNSPNGGVVTEIHLVLIPSSHAPGSRGEMQRHVALSVTYDGLPYPSVFVPVGDFMLDQRDSNSNNFESIYFAKRPTNSWHCFIPMPYKTSIKIELVSKASMTISGYNYIYHDSTPFQAGSGYFHAYFASNPSLRFPWDAAPLLPREGLEGPGHMLGSAMVFVGKDPTRFNKNFNHVCEGNYEMFFDNTTRVFGNDSSVPYRAVGYQTSPHVVAILGSEDWYGYSYGWGGDEVALGKAGMLGTQHSGTTIWDPGNVKVDRTLATYRFFPSPLRFTQRAWGQVNWQYDIGHNVPADLCPPGEGCDIAYSVMSYWYLAKPRNASAEMDELPWPYPGGKVTS